MAVGQPERLRRLSGPPFLATIITDRIGVFGGRIGGIDRGA
jgi:hypothetical protein